MATIREIDVINYRSVGQEGAHISFPDDSPVVLLGENNAGKSNLVNAALLILGESWPKSYDPNDHDFYGRQRDRRICIDVYFDPSDRYGGSFEQVKYRYDPNSDGDPVTFGGRPPLNPRHGDMSYISGDDRESCICIVVGADRNLDYQLSYKSKYTFLSKLMHRFHKALLDDEEVKADLEDIFADIKDKFHDIDQFSSFVQGLQDNLDDLVASMTHRLEVDFEAYNPVNFFRALRLQAVEGDNVRTIDELGTGEEQVLAISFAHAYAQAFHGGIFLIIEEPEAHLHPIMQRWLSRRIHAMSEDGLQVLMTTHSPAFIDLLNLEGLVLVKKDESGTYTVQHSPQELVDHCVDTGVPADKVDADNILPFYKANATQELLSGFFADKVVLVEGPTEELALPEYLRGVGFDVLEEGVEVLGVGGKGNLAKWWRMFTLYGIPTFVIFDNDDSDDGNHSRRRDALGALEIDDNEIDAVVDTNEWLIDEEYAVFGVDFEEALRDRFPNYEDLEDEGAETIGNNSKPFIARYVARQLEYQDDHPGWAKFEELAAAISNLEV
jgi:putative ATP-dependent endonuclease of OLD family